MKAILILEMPKNCFKCKLQDWANCRIVKGCHTGETRPDWCPLKPMPSKKVLSGDVADIQKMGKELMDIGYNHCIDEILGDKE